VVEGEFTVAAFHDVQVDRDRRAPGSVADVFFRFEQQAAVGVVLEVTGAFERVEGGGVAVAGPADRADGQDRYLGVAGQLS